MYCFVVLQAGQEIIIILTFNVTTQPIYNIDILIFKF